MTRGFLAAALLLATGSRAIADPADCDDASQLARDPAGDRLSTVYFGPGSAAVTGAERAAAARCVVRGTDRGFPELVQEQHEADRPQRPAERPRRAAARRAPTEP